MRHKGDDVEAHALVHALVPAAPLGNEAHEEKLPDLGELGVEHSDQGRVHGGVGEGGGLRLHQGPAKQASASVDVFPKQLGHHPLDVGGVELVDEPIDGAFQGVPGEALGVSVPLLGGGVGEGSSRLGLLQGRQLGRRNVGSTWSWWGCSCVSV